MKIGVLSSIISGVIAVILGFIIPGTFEDEFIVSKIILLIFIGFSSVGLYEALCLLIKDRFSVDIKKIYNNLINSRNKNEAIDQTQEDVPQYEDDTYKNDSNS